MDIKKIWMAILIVVSIGLLTSAASAQTIGISDGSADTGNTTTVTITADDVIDLANFDITVTYDPAVVNVTDAANDVAFGTAINNLENAAAGTVRLASFNLGDGQTGDDILLSTLTMEAVGTAVQTSTLTLTIHELKTSSEENIVAATDDGMFTVTGTDTTAPTITDKTPTGTNVPVSTVVNVTFSEAMDQTSAEGAFSTTPWVDGSFSWSGTTMVFNPDTSLAYDTTYAVTIETGATDLAGNPLEDAFNWDFTTASGGGTTAPTVTAKTPTGTNVPVLTAMISVAFDEAMNRTSAEGAFSIDPAVAGSFRWFGNTLIFDLNTSLAYGTTYAVTIGTGATDLAGNSLEDAVNWDFTTASEGVPGGDTAAPTIIANAPTGTGVSVSTVIGVVFDEAMNPASAEDAFSIVPPVAGSFSWVGTTMIFDPDTSLTYGTTYAVTIGTGATDLAGNSLGDPFIWDFTTESAPAPTIASGDPASPVSDIAGATRSFSITVDQTANVTWLINGTQVQLNVSVTEASYTNTSAVPGCWNVSAVAENENGTDMQTWIWDVAETTGADVTGKTNFTASSGDANVTGNFSNSLSGWINVTDTGDDPAASPDVNGSTLRAGLGDLDVFVSGVYIDVSMSNIEDEMAAGNGSMRIELHYIDAKLAALGITDENTPDIYKFNETTDMWELVRTQSYCIDSGRNTTANYVYVEVTELCTFALVGKSSAPTLVTYTITNTTITPPQTTSIDVKFSEPVSAIIKIEDASGNLVNELYTSSGVTNPDPQIWNGTYTNGTTVPDGTYTVNVSGVSTTTGLSVIDTSKTINVLAAGTVGVTLYEGWNLIAVPVNDPTANTAAELASKIDGCKEVVKWDASTQTYDPYTRIVGDWTGTNFAITGDMGIFVNVKGTTTVDFTGGAWR